MALHEVVAVLEKTRTSYHAWLAAAVQLSQVLKVSGLVPESTFSAVPAVSSRCLATSQCTPSILRAGHSPPGYYHLQRRNLSMGPMGMDFRRQMCRWSTALADVAPRPADVQETGYEALSHPIVPAATGKEVVSERGVDVRMESQVIFDSCWRRFEDKYRLNNVFVPREVVFLNGAPGAGKGANTSHILAARGLEQVICVSSLLETHAESREIINRGDMIPDTLVGDVLFHALLISSCRAPDCGVLVDGFPRTALQVDFLKLLNDKLTELHSIWANTAHEQQFPRPMFKVVMLYVDEETSIARQMARAKVAHLHNKHVKDAGAGGYVEQRATDQSVEKCKKRYAVFKQHYAASLRLKQFFPFHLIDAMGDLEETQEAITEELRYQSSLDLSQATYYSIRHLPPSRDLAQYARQQLVTRLDDHCEKFPTLFQKVIDIITAEIVPMLKESGMSGQAEYSCDLRLFNDHPRAAQMLMDVLTDRGFKSSYSITAAYVPVQIDLTTGVIKNRRETKHRFNIWWEIPNVRDAAKVIEIEARMAESQGGGSGMTKLDSVRISQSFIPPPQPQPPKEARHPGSSMPPWHPCHGGPGAHASTLEAPCHPGTHAMVALVPMLAPWKLHATYCVMGAQGFVIMSVKTPSRLLPSK
eukprot:gene13833-19754_t